MREKRNVLIGFELGEHVSRICYYDREAGEPLPIPVAEGPEEADEWEFPTALAKYPGRDEWLVGADALRASGEEEGAAAVFPSGAGDERSGGESVSLCSLLLRDENIEAGGVLCTAAELFAVFLRESLRLTGLSDPVRCISGLGITVPVTDPSLVLAVRDGCELLGFSPAAVCILGREESFYYYGFSQRPEVSSRTMGLLSFSGVSVSFYSMSENRMRKPFVSRLVKMGETELPEEEISRDAALQRALAEWMEGSSYSGVFVTGEGFSPDWAKGSVRELSSRGAHVFLGDNLFVKGACQAVYERKEGRAFHGRVFRGADQLTVSVGLELIEGNVQKFHPLLSAGTNWYEGRTEADILPDGRRDLQLVVAREDGKTHWNEKIQLPGLPARPERTTRLRVSLSCLTPERCVCRVEDLGFGEFFPATHQVWTHEILLPGGAV